MTDRFSSSKTNYICAKRVEKSGSVANDRRPITLGTTLPRSELAEYFSACVVQEYYALENRRGHDTPRSDAQLTSAIRQICEELRWLHEEFRFYGEPAARTVRRWLAAHEATCFADSIY